LLLKISIKKYKMIQLLNNILSSNYIILLICISFSIILGLIIFGLSYFVAVQNPDSEKMSAYECGFEPFEDARNKFDVRFYIVAILFIIFDVEVVYLFP
jgi:NADH-quinone oxidoreductase subunit A